MGDDKDEALKPDAIIKMRVMVTMYADVTLTVHNHPDGKGSFVKTEIPEKSLLVNYYGHFNEQGTNVDAPDRKVQAFLTTGAAHTMVGIAEQKLARKLEVRSSSDEGPGNTQPPSESIN